jgi:hypothetical protein
MLRTMSRPSRSEQERLESLEGVAACHDEIQRSVGVLDVRLRQISIGDHQAPATGLSWRARSWAGWPTVSTMLKISWARCWPLTRTPAGVRMEVRMIENRVCRWKPTRKTT